MKEICKEHSPQHVLDLCAAPGGKSTLLASALPGSFIVSNEVIKTRVSILAENVSKWGNDHIIVTNNDPKHFSRLPGFFDLLVVDAPCSGSGLFRKDEDAIDEWSEANVQLCSLRQQRIIADAINCLKQDGYLIYSTCSYSKQENEDICDWIVDEHHLTPVSIPVPAEWNIVETTSDKHKAPAYRFYPSKIKGEGFFIACFKQGNPVNEDYRHHHKSSSASKQVLAMVSTYMSNIDAYHLSGDNDLIIASLKKWQQETTFIQKALNVRKSGVAIGSVKGKDFIPHHELALSHLISDAVSTIELDKEQALKYLRRQDLSINTNQRGWTLSTFQKISLGWMKVLPNRVNNYYPTNWRILKQ